MPTAGRLIAAICFGLFAWYMAGIAQPYFPEGIAPASLIPVSAVMGVFVGWQVCGSRAGLGYVPAVGHGVTAALVFGFCALYVFGFSSMIGKAMKHYYNGAIEAFLGSFSETAKMGGYFLNAHMIGSLLIGGVICAWCAEYFAKRYP